MKTHLLASLCLIVAATDLPAREFTDLQGRKINAEIVSANGNQAILKRVADGRSFNVNISTFSAPDQKFIREFAETNLKYNFEVRIAKEKIDESKKSTALTGTVRIYTPVGTTSAQTFGKLTEENESWVYKVEIKNRLSIPVSELRVDFWCFRRKDWGQGKEAAHIAHSGTTNIKAITSGASTAFETGSITLYKMKLQGFIYTDGTRSQQIDGMGGIVLRIFNKNGREIHTFSTDDKLLPMAIGDPSAPPPPLPLPSGGK